jgi:patatin-like phospholipase/acyl hydrolase
MADNLADIKKMMEQLTQAQLTHKAPDNRKIRLLCLDGGGVKGVSSLRMLQEIMDEVDRLERLKESEGESTDENSHGRQNEPRPPLKPCQYFDLICGTSTGGLIALMLGRLEYVSSHG